jgi:putative endonuclease
MEVTMKLTELKSNAINAAEKYLLLTGKQMLEKSWNCDAGTADIVMKDSNTLVFCEVNARCDTGHTEFPEETITAAKRKRFERIALDYIASHELASDCKVRFDIISLVIVDGSRALVKHHVNALGPM